MNVKKFISDTGSEYITSRQNPRVVLYSGLKEEKIRLREKLFSAEGTKLTEEAVKSAEVREILVSESFFDSPMCERIFETAIQKQIKITVLSDTAFEKISTEKAPQGVIAIVKMMSGLYVNDGFDDWQTDKRLILLDEIRDPGNLGTIIRSSEALGIDGIILAGCADIYNPKTVRSAMGALFRMPIYVSSDAPETVRKLKNTGRRVICATLGENNLTLGEYETKKTDCIVIGNEGHGISPDVIAESGMCVRIPMAGETESLNASAAAVCIMWEYYRQNR